VSYVHLEITHKAEKLMNIFTGQRRHIDSIEFRGILLLHFPWLTLVSLTVNRISK